MSIKDFEIGQTLGKGAFGSVCIVKRKIDNQVYAMKRVNISKLSTKERENALNEIRILASLSHPNVIGYKEAFYDEPSKTINIVMELADDGDIASKIKHNFESHLFFKEKTIWSILIQILQGMKYLHDNNIIHRDLKSANLFLMKNGLVKIGDLNVSKIAKLGMAYTQIGTPYYASPEIWKDKPYDSKTDIWSIGCIVYEMCALKPPFRGTSLVNLAENIKKGVYSKIPKIYSSDLSKVIEYMLNVNPAMRKSCDELLNLDIVVAKMKEVHAEQYLEGPSDNKVSLIQTLKIPKKMKDINNMLPVKRYKKKEEDMMMHDEYETKKNGFFNNNNNCNKEVLAPKAQIQLDSGEKSNNNNNVIDYNELIKQHEDFKRKALDDKRRQQAQQFLAKNKSKEDIKKKPVVHIAPSKPSSNYNHKVKIVSNHNNNNKRPYSGVNKPSNVVIKKTPIISNAPKTPSSSSKNQGANGNYNLIIKNPNYKVPSIHRPQSGKAPVNNRIELNKKSPVSNSNRPVVSHPQKKKVIYEKVNYNAYIANKKKTPAKKPAGYRPKIGNKK